MKNSSPRLDFSLPDHQGNLINIWDFRQKYNLILLLIRSIEASSWQLYFDWLKDLSPYVHELKCKILLITPDIFSFSKNILTPLFSQRVILLKDANLKVVSTFLEENQTSGILVVDRYGEIWYQWTGHKEEHLPLPQDIIDWLDFIERQCPE